MILQNPAPAILLDFYGRLMSTEILITAGHKNESLSSCHLFFFETHVQSILHISTLPENITNHACRSWDN